MGDETVWGQAWNFFGRESLIWRGEASHGGLWLALARRDQDWMGEARYGFATRQDSGLEQHNVKKAVAAGRDRQLFNSMMNTPRRNFWFRKDVAQILEVSPQTVRRNESRLGLDKARCDISERGMVRYNARIAQQELEQRGLWP